MNNSHWFKTGIYRKQLTTIAILLLILTLGQIASCVNSFFDKKYGTEEVLVKGVQVSSIQAEDVDENGIQFQGPDGRTIMMPKEMRGYEKLIGFYEDSIVRIYVDDSMQKQSDYQIRLSDDLIEIWDNERLVHVLRYSTSLGRVIMEDNEFKKR